MNKAVKLKVNQSNEKMDLNNRNVGVLTVRGITVISLLSALATFLMIFEIPLWFAPGFYELDLSELPVLIGAFALGPIAGVFIELIKILLNFLINGTDSAGIGEIANFIVGCSLAVPSAIIYHRNKSKKSAILGMCVGTIIFIITGCILNAYVLLPTYARLFMPMDSLIAMGTEVNPRINNMTTFVLFAVAPFNLLKGVVVSVFTALIYDKISPIIKGYHHKKN